MQESTLSAMCSLHQVSGKPVTHSTEKCCKWNTNGIPKKPSKFEGKVKKANKAFTQMTSKCDANKKLLKKAFQMQRVQEEKQQAL